MLEEPESFLHPRYLKELATLLVKAARKGRQVILSTHSMELIDLLLHGTDVSEGFPTVHRMSLVDGTLSGIAMAHQLAMAARDELLEDLRS